MNRYELIQKRICDLLNEIDRLIEKKDYRFINVLNKIKNELEALYKDLRYPSGEDYYEIEQKLFTIEGIVSSIKVKMGVV